MSVTAVVPMEIEIKLALPAVPADAAGWAAQLARIPLLARRKVLRQQVHSVYYDTPAQTLRAQRAALRLRRVGTPEQPQWLQTLKTAGRSDSALSQRGEWEMPVAGPALELAALHDSPWPQMDAAGDIAAALVPCFVTDFERTTWRVTQPGGVMVEVALDVGTISAAGHTAPLCELELELLAGPPAALFALAQKIARTVPVLPLAASKAERGFALAQHGQALTVVTARPKQLPLQRPTVQALARCVLGEMFQQFSANLYGLQSGAAAPEWAHQARVGWRRFRSVCRLLRPLLAAWPMPDATALRPLHSHLGHLRDLQVAQTETLPRWVDAYVDGDAARAAAWQALQVHLEQAVARQLQLVRDSLAQPAVGQTLLAVSHWLETLDGPLARVSNSTAPLPRRQAKRWVRRRMERLAHAWQLALNAALDLQPEPLHRARILAKRLRYCTEALAVWLPRRMRHQHRTAQHWQMQLGTARDVAQASVLAAHCAADSGLVEFLRGVALGQARVVASSAAPAQQG